MDADAGRVHTGRRARVLSAVTGLAALALVGAVGAGSSWSMLRTYGDKTEGRTGVILCTFTAPAMFAAGKGMRSVEFGRFPTFDDFYFLRTSSFDVADLPEDYRGSEATSSYCLMHWHLMYAIGWTWRILGVSHGSLHVLAALLYTSLMLVLYGLFRMGMGRALSLGIVLWLSLSPALLIICASLRDFSKAPFLLGAVLILVYLAGQERSGRSLSLWSIFLGIVVGLGFGFRQDVALAVPLALAGLSIAIPLRTPHPWMARLAAVAIFLTVFVAVGWTPIRGTRSDKGSATAQAFVQGVSEEAEARLDFGGASYTHHYGYSDWLDFTIVNAYARRTGDTSPMPGHFSMQHGQAGQRLVREYGRVFPGDMVARALASLWMLPRISSMLDQGYLWCAPEPNVEYLKARLKWYEPFARTAVVWGWPALAGALALLYVSQPRRALFLGGAVLFLGAYPSLLYEYRHFFHLAFLPYWAAGAVVSQSVALARRAFREAGFGWVMARRLGVFGGITVGVVAALLGIQAGARAWQDRTLNRLCEQYASAPLEPWPYTTSEETDGVLIQPGAPLPNLEKTASLPSYETAAEYLAFEFQNVDRDLPLRIVYDKDPVTDFSRSIVLPRELFGETGTGRYFVPVYQLVWPGPSNGAPLWRGHFRGIACSPEVLKGFRGMWRVRDGQGFRLWPYVVIPENFTCFLPHKRGPFDHVVEWIAARIGMSGK